SSTGLEPAPPQRPTESAAVEAVDASPLEERADIKPGINARFLDPNLDVARWQKTFEGESREVYAARKEVIEALQLAPGQSVADIGAGTGFYLWAFADAVGPTGHVFGVEIAPRFLERLREHVAEEK